MTSGERDGVEEPKMLGSIPLRRINGPHGALRALDKLYESPSHSHRLAAYLRLRAYVNGLRRAAALRARGDEKGR